MIVSRMHGLTLTVRGANKNPGAQVVPWTKTRRDDSQWWYEDYQPGTIRSALNGFCLEAEGNLRRTQDKKEPPKYYRLMLGNHGQCSGLNLTFWIYHHLLMRSSTLMLIPIDFLVSSTSPLLPLMLILLLLLIR